MRRKKLVRLLKFVEGAWRVVGYGIPELADVYTSMGYLVEF